MAESFVRAVSESGEETFEVEDSTGECVSRLLYCGHCHNKVPKSTYYRHRLQFYDEFRQVWQTGSLLYHFTVRLLGSFDDARDDNTYFNLVGQCWR